MPAYTELLHLAAGGYDTTEYARPNMATLDYWRFHLAAAAITLASSVQSPRDAMTLMALVNVSLQMSLPPALVAEHAMRMRSL